MQTEEETQNTLESRNYNPQLHLSQIVGMKIFVTSYL